MSVNLLKNVTVPQSGYTPCACRDCMDITVSSDTAKPELCSECADAGCEAYPAALAAVDYTITPAACFGCQRDDAYGEGCTCDYLKAQYDPNYRQCAFCASLEGRR